VNSGYGTYNQPYCLTGDNACKATHYVQVASGKSFSLAMGKMNSYDLTTGTNNGITATNTNGVLYLSGTLTSNKTATFGNTIFEFIVKPSYTAGVGSVSLY
jgi:hypothetical protein